jgi:ferredoxin-NADP reductase/predicted pyridoxine 5'-phosphate oxidase superfamily flavin-nucleotide-binding protein
MATAPEPIAAPAPVPAPAPGWDLERSPFHPGELAIQERVGVRAKMDAQGRRALRRVLTAQHRAFFPLLPYVFVGSVDAAGRPWASMLLGEPGFVTTPDERTMRVRARPLFGDPLGDALRDGAELALLGVQLHTRRRNRAFGAIRDVSEAGFTLDVRQAMGICPQYIQGREIVFDRDPLAPPPARTVHRGTTIDAAARAIIAAADTYFVASVDPRAEDDVAHGADVSHRGGRPGFVRVDDPHTLTAPDFVGNFIFNTIGNWQIDPRAGLLFIDFAGGDMLYIAARAEVIWEGAELRAFAGAQRLFRYHVEEVIRVEASLPGRFSAPDYSPLLARTGAWDEVAGTLEAERLRTVWRPFRVAAIADESATIRSFLLEPADDAGLAAFQAGQHLPVRVRPDGWAESVIRPYSLSDAPDGRHYRISVKREGRGGVSDWLHDRLRPGDTIEALAPRGGFTLDETAGRAVVMLSAGVGITPMIAMLNSVLVNEGRTRLHQPIRFIHAATDGRAHAFGEHLRRKAALHSNLSVHVVYSRPGAEDALGRTHDSEGRIDRALLQRLLPLDDYEVYLCGPPGFMQASYDALLSLGVPDAQIHAETFGPATIARRRAVAPPREDGEGIAVAFARSGKTAMWRPSSGSLLDLAEASGLAPLSACRAGTCGTCSTRLLSGWVDYDEPPAHEIAPGEALICVARPRPGPHGDDGAADREGVSLDL